uniref:TOD1/MUCI70 glycosyltransferase-like domain-containing protein n=1 Tax=Emiliania huxleyi TaxID=2903 RepID=A0A7S3VZB0_EMIHU
MLNATGACAAFVGLPAHRFAFGERPLATNQRLTLSLHAQEIEAASRHRSTTDSIDLLHKQVHAYTDEKAASVELEGALIDSAFFLQDQTAPQCRAHNAELGCTWLNEVACFSDRDQLSFPAVVAGKLQLTMEIQRGQKWLAAPQNWTTKQLFGKRATDRLFRDRTGVPRVVIAAPHQLHWYYHR